MIKLFGESPRYLLFTDDVNAVVIDKTMNMVENTGSLSLLASAQVWDQEKAKAEKHYYDLAAGALADLKVQVIVASGRMYSIPKSAQAEAKKALEWRKEHDRGGTPVGLNTARTLAAGGQIGIQKVRHIAKYFPRHEVDKKGKGWSPGEDGFPSNGRIAWALWGGDAAWTWARAIVERENKKAVRADGYIIESDGTSFEDYEMPSAYDADLDFFKSARESQEGYGPEFVARTRMDGTGIDRLYAISTEGRTSVWDGSSWDDLGVEDSDIYSYDMALDDDEFEDEVERSHIFIDPESALIVSAYLQTSPFAPVSVDDIDGEEAAMVFQAMDGMDWSVTDAVLTAAGEAPTSSKGPSAQYTPAERAKNAKRQVRDKGGKFASKGSRVVVGGDPSKSGSITRINPDTQSVVVKLDSGQSVEVPAMQTEKAPAAAPAAVDSAAPAAQVDLSGILGQPRAPANNPKAVIPNGLPALTSDQIGQALADFPAWVKSQRDASQANKYTPPTKQEIAARTDKLVKQTEKYAGFKLERGDLRQHPVYSKLFKKNPKYNLYYDAPAATTAAAESPTGTALTPDTSDVQPMYMAIVSPEDPTAVFDLVAVVPASTKSTSPMTYKREDKEWVKDEQILADLNSATPPPVVPLEGDNLMDTLSQLDGAVTASLEAIIAEGGLDRNRGNAEKLRNYWLYGKGALKIRWNTPGDWSRCYRHLSKYMGLRAKGYCSLRHKEATGVWPGSKYNIGKKNKKKNLIRASALGDITLPTETEVLETLYRNARIADAKSRVLLATGAYEINGHDNVSGAKFTIPLVIPEGTESGDGRKFRKGSIEVRELPLPLMWQIKTAEGHDGSVVVGRIDHMERTDGGIGNARGVFDTSAYGKEAERMVRDGFIRGVSADLDRFEASEEDAEEASENNEAAKKKKKIGGSKINIDRARVMAVTIVPKPAFQECSIRLEEDTNVGESQEENMRQAPDGIYVEEMEGSEAQSIVACGMIAGAIPAVPPAAWLVNPKLTGPTPLTVDDDGRVFGHIAAWHVNHIGMTAGTKPPRSKSKYAFFHTGVLRADDGKDYPVGQLTLAGGHASLDASAMDAARHYDDTGSAIADVHAGEDTYGIWVAGSLRPSASPEQIRALRASAPSGDWRPINGALELVAVCQVNVPGFPIARAYVASGQVYALVAAGAQVLAKLKSDPITELAQRLDAIENKEKYELAAKADEAKLRFASIKAEKTAALAARMSEISARVRGAEAAAETVEEPTAAVTTVSTEELKARVASAAAEAELASISMKARQRLASEGKALPDGSYPIRNGGDLKNAIQAYGRSKPSDRAKVRRHIVKRARALGKPEVIPNEWKTASIVAEDVADLRAQVAAAQAALLDGDNPKARRPEAVVASRAPGRYISGVNQPRDSKGQFRQVLARLKQDLGASGLQNVVEKVQEAENLDNAGNYTAAVSAASELLGIIDRLDSGGLNPQSLENVRSSARALGQIISNLPLPFADQTNKVRYSDLPPVLKNLMDDMMQKVEDKIGKEDADVATQRLRKYKSGDGMFSQGEVSSEMNVLLRLLT
jgi:hypothetical protein